ncbi:MAG TPA: ubiquinol-cytochrome c reductase iron-sulfur subunit [Bryobacteraceae bacterium]|nr:ubiquinol-cytochrome c reductase iron-sulfur subunit [Bryobacteraceae bacterium]
MTGPPASGTAKESLTRRNFYVGAIYGIGALIGAALGVPAAIYLLFPPKIREASQWVEIGDVGSLTADSPTEMTFRHNRVDGWKVTSEKATAWVVKHADNSITAFGPQCTHLGCAYHWDDGKTEFICPCHNSFFSIDGKVLGGPAPRPLDRYETRIAGKKLMIGRLLAPERQA